MVDREFRAIALAGGDDPVGVGQAAGDRFFAEDAAHAGVGGGTDRVGVVVVRRGDADDVEFLAGEHRGVVRVFPHQAAWHARPCLGALDELPTAEPAAAAMLTGPCGYDRFANIRRLREMGKARPRWQSGPASLTAYLPAGDSERFLAIAPGNPAADVVSVLVRRQVAETALFVTVLVPAATGATREVRRVEWLSTTPLVVAIETVTGVDRWEIAPDGNGARLEATR